ncbi:TlpA family protein disulfide reductase [Parvibacter caecicola]|uniref:TlpA family protein disulfide reductase n=1 Tax=Parvibacter caecicola TaxID=747645 RepID=A0A4T9T765_9ACTN|nr:TlpA disulfide reductase family protein [Parvibacter caecicola]TJW10306.1 TlpA family protein disulfide reductase [Parvibacter caecicola]
MKKISAKLTAAFAAATMGLFAVGCSVAPAPTPVDSGNGANATAPQAPDGSNGNGQGGGQGNGNSNGQGQGNGQGNGWQHHEDEHHGNGYGNGGGNGWEGTDVAQAPTVSNLGDFSAATIDGGTFAAADLASKDITIVNFWSTTCPPCVAEMPDLAEIQRELPANVQLITVLLDGQSGVQEAQSILGQAGYRGVTLVPTQDSGDLVSAVSDIMYMPTTVLYDSQGVALSEFVGGQMDLEDTIENAVNHQLSLMNKPVIDL